MISALILAKRDSNRLKDKNILSFYGKPMFLVNVEKCLKIFDKVYVSSDSLDILNLALKAGASPIVRTKDLCGDTPNIPVYRHAMQTMELTVCDAFVAVQANSPTVDFGLIYATKKLLETGWQEIMTCHEDYKIYGSIWAMTADRLKNYGDPYQPKPEILIVDESVDIHTMENFNEALKQA